MRILTAAILILAMGSCASPEEQESRKRTGLNNLKTLELEGCQYFSVTGSYGYGNITHKGNCNNPIHKCH